MNAMPLSSQTAIKQPSKVAESKPASSAAAETVDFAQLLDSFSASSTEAQTAAGEQQEEQVKIIEDLLASLKELPQEDLTTEQQDLLQAVMQLLTQQLQPLEEKVQNSNLKSEGILTPAPLQQNAGMEETVQKALLLSAPDLEKLASSPPNQEKLTALLEEASKVLQKLTDVQAKNNSTAGVPVDIEKLEHISGQLTNLIDELKTVQEKNEAKTAVVQVQQLEQVLKQVTGLKQEPVNMIQPKETQPAPAISAVQNIAEVQALSEETAPKAQEASSTEPVEQRPLNVPPEGAKANPSPQRIETSTQQATVRMSNMVEELSEVLRGSFRLNGEGDSKQIRISIFPEHLGHMDIRVTLIDGKMVAQLFTSSLAAKEALEQQANLLRSSLVQQGITVEKIEVAQQSPQHSFGQQSAHADQRFAQQQKQGSLARNRNGYQRIEDDSAAIIRSQTNDGLTMKVDYTI